jgi:hypothetical protein
VARNKKPKTSLIGNTLGGKHPKAESPPNWNDYPPSWRISRIEMEGPFGWGGIPRDKLDEVLKKLGEFESRTWNEILVLSNKQNHEISVERLSPEAQRRLEEIQLGDIEELISLRLSSRERVFGIRESATLLVLWWDPEHQVCPSILKHT